MIEGEQGRGGIRTATPEAASHRNTLANANADPRGRFGSAFRLGGRDERPGGTNAKVLVGRDRREGTRVRETVISTFNHPDGRRFERQFVAQIDELKNGLQLVITVGTSTRDVQTKIELRRR
jgi:hypothetical protein